MTYLVWQEIPYEGASENRFDTWQEALDFVAECAGKKRELAIRNITRYGFHELGREKNRIYITSDRLTGPVDKNSRN